MTCPELDWLTDPVRRLDKKNSFDASLVMGTANFNRNTGRPERLHPPFSQFIDQGTGLIRTDMLRPRNCPVCSSPPGPGLFVKDGFRHVRCPQCDLIYVSLILREDLMIKFWREELSWRQVLMSAPQVELDSKKYDYGLDLVSAHVPNRKVLDIGTGTGAFLKTAVARGWDATGLELNVESVENLLKEGMRIIVKPLEISDLSSHSFDLVTLWEVLEHLADPALVLAQARRLLTRQGLLLILVPNSGSLVTRVLHEKSNTFGGHSHLNHFNLKSITSLLNSLHYEIVELETVITELGTINNHLNFQDPYLGDAPPFFSVLTPEFIHDNLLGSRLMILARPSDKKSVGAPSQTPLPSNEAAI
ncbi:MAG: class I SAM-dependent methyltransferase [Deltaproteobacteria bacterium]|jgi:2-polyprenyl-3-methyl-5-hydroxy-6-metoxy-1,4-benzoquinol methylase|nr:class I SAM-dependent methyltransferase [Deltaproteobacteria bacterium]